VRCGYERLGVVHLDGTKILNVEIGLPKIACVETSKHLEGLAQRGQNVALRPIFSSIDFKSIVEITGGVVIEALSVHRHGISTLVEASVKAKPYSPDLFEEAKARTSVGFCCGKICSSRKYSQYSEKLHSFNYNL
jgi:hypothetical protein